MLLQRQAEISLFLIKFNLAKYKIVPVYFQKVLQSDFKNSKVELIIQNTFANLCDFLTKPLHRTVLGIINETVEDIGLREV